MALVLDGLELDARLGEGGMGEVWRARHLASGELVAVKWIRRKRASQRDLRPAFQREVEAMAAMDHPGIVLVYDHGAVSEQSATASQGRLQAGAPYVVLEHASGGCLDDRPPATHWDQVLPVLLDTLDALAHAHARGVIHRDLKPANLLLCGPDDARPGLKLADFGLARLLTGDHEGPRHAGTPWYMAPEQFQGRWRDLGPATDLYSVGCLAWELVTGAAPFTHPTLTELRQHHLHAPLPDLAARFPVPDDFADWLSWCLEKTASYRPESAAAAAFALQQLGPATRGTDAPSVTPMRTRRSTPTFTWTAIEVSDEHFDGSRGPRRRPARPPLTDRWHQQAEARPPTLLAGAGLGLFAVRPAPFTGRLEERARLWSELKKAFDRGPRALVLHGPEGVGTSRLARWVAERAAELGQATPRVVRLTDASSALDRWLDTQLQLDGLAAQERTARIGQRAADPGPLLDRERGELDTAGALTGWLVAEARQRPQVLILDDAHLDPAAAALARRLLAAGTLAPVPILVLLTVRDAPDTQAADALAERLGCDTLPVVPFTLDDSTSLLARTLDLDPGLAAVLHDRSGGRPGLMLQVVGDWVLNGHLRPGERGFVVADTLADALPASLAEAWTRRSEALTAALSPDDRAALAFAVTAGFRPPADLEAVICSAGLDLQPVLRRLISEGLAIREGDRWSFAAPTAHAALEQALDADTLRRAHQAHADWLEGTDSPYLNERLGQHHFALENWEAAARHLGDATKRFSDMGPRCLSLIERAMHALDRGGFGPHASLRHELLIRRLALLVNMHHPGASAELPTVIAAMEHPDATDAFLSLARKIYAQVLARLGRLDEAEALCEVILAEDPSFISTRLLQGRISLLRGDYPTATRRMQWVLDADADNPYHRAAALTGLGDAAIATGRLEEAWRYNADAHALAEEHGWRDVMTSGLNLAQIEIDRGHHEAACDRLEQIRREASHKLEWFPLLAALSLQCHSAACLGRWDTVDESLELLEPVQRIIPTPDPDIARHLAAAATCAEDAGHVDRARRAWSYGRLHAEKLGKAELLASHAHLVAEES